MLYKCVSRNTVGRCGTHNDLSVDTGKISVVALRKTAKFGIEKLTENTY